MSGGNIAMEMYPANWKRKIFMGSLFLHRMFLRRRSRDLSIVISNHFKLSDYDPRAATIELMSREIYRYSVEGNTAELGVYQGGFSRLINHYFPDRKLYLFDTFEGFAQNDVEADKAKGIPSDTARNFSSTSVELVLSKMEHPENCIIRKGWFPDTAQGIDDRFCFVSLDADLYKPLISGLEFFYPKLSHGGIIMIHDFNNGDYPRAREAVKDFCDDNNIGYVCISDHCGSAVITK